MSKLIVEGGKRLEGNIRVPGAKNTVLPILAATIISGRESVIEDCPEIKDVELTVEILKNLGCKIKREGRTLTVDSSGINDYTIKEELMDKMRSSIILTGAILARMKKAKTTYPGGCELGLRPIDLHIKAFKELNISVVEEGGYIMFDAENAKCGDIHLAFPSVGATENIMLVAAAIKGTTKIINAAKEPEINDLAEFLIKMGCKVSGAGTSVITIEGTDSFNNVNHTLIPDRIVASTIMAAAAVTGSTVEINNVNTEHIGAVISAFREMGVLVFKTMDNSVVVSAAGRIKPLNLLRTSPYPGFPTDAQSIITSVLSVAEGTSIVIENIFEQRFKHTEELIKMGADVTVDGRCAVIKGVERLKGAKVSARDLRSGAALVVAGLCAEGFTEIDNLYHIDRGYENTLLNLQEIGANITKVAGN